MDLLLNPWSCTSDALCFLMFLGENPGDLTPSEDHRLEIKRSVDLDSVGSCSIAMSEGDFIPVQIRE